MTALQDLETALRTNDPSPLYQKLQRAMRQAIEKNIWSTSDALPAEREIAETLKISRITVRKAIDGLVHEGLLMRRQGSGTFVAPRVEKSFATLTSFTEDMVSRGRKPRSEWLIKDSGLVTPEESLMLALSPGSSVYRFHRIRYADDIPMALEYATVPSFCLHGVNDVETSLYTALESTGFRPVRALQRLRAVQFTNAQADLLGVEPGAAGLLIERRGFAGNGAPVERTESFYRGDAYDFVAELNLGATETQSRG